MVSKGANAVAALYRHWTSVFEQNPDMTLDNHRDELEHWGDITREPGRVDYIEVNCDGVQAMWAAPKDASQSHVLVCLHGGGYAGGSMYSHRKLFGHMAKAIGCRALIVNYRLAPEHLFPAAIDDSVVCYRWLLKQGIQGNNIAVAGDSAGGALALALQFRIRDEGEPRPAGSLLLSPWTDLEGTGESVSRNADRDLLVTPKIMELNRLTYLGADGDPRHPLASPLYGDFKDIAPIYIQVGSEELILDDSHRTAERAKAAGVDVKVEVYPDMQHVFHFAAGNAPEADSAIRAFADWIRPKLGL